MPVVVDQNGKTCYLVDTGNMSTEETQKFVTKMKTVIQNARMNPQKFISAEDYHVPAP